MDFDHFNNVIEEKKLDLVEDKYGENYVLMVAIHNLPISEINFEAFTCDDAIEVFSSIEEAITDENEDSEISLDPAHPYTQIVSLGLKFSRMEGYEKVMSPSPFLFI